MDNRIKTAFYWLLLGICFLAHNLFELSGLFFGKTIAIPDATGEIPLGVHIFTVVVVIGTFLLSLLAINLTVRPFRWFSLVWASLFLLLNIFHLVEVAFIQAFDLSQACLLSLVLAVNVLLILDLWKTIKQKQ